MINFSLQKQLQIFTPNTNKALELVLKSATPEQLSLLSKAKDLGAVLESILQKSLQDPKQNAALLDLLKNNPTLRSLGDMQSTLQTLKTTLEQTHAESELQKRVTSLLQNIGEIEAGTLKKKILNSGIFLESNIKNSKMPLHDISTNDLKALLLKSQEELANAASPKAQELLKTIDKALLQIDYYQLHSQLQSGASFYLPYSWDDLKDAQVTLKHAKERLYICDIELTLKAYGSLKLRLALFDKKELTIEIQVESQDLKSKMQEHLSELRQALQRVSITPKTIRFTEEKNENLYAYDDAVCVGFEVKV